MDSYLLAAVVFACVFAGSMVGLWLNAWLPENHRSAASHDAIKLGTGMISVLASLVLGLLTASIKNSFDTTDAFVICSIALAACLFIITEMDTPFDGLIVISSHAMRDALAHT